MSFRIENRFGSIGHSLSLGIWRKAKRYTLIDFYDNTKEQPASKNRERKFAVVFAAGIW